MSLKSYSRALFALFVLSSLSPSVCLAYLDPGTGSLLLSSIVAIFASVVYFFKNLFYKITSLSPKSLKFSYAIKGGGGNAHNLGKSTQNLDSHQNPNSITFYCEGKQYYGSFKPILDTLDILKHPYTYLTSDENDPALKRESNNFSIKEFIGTGNKAYTRLNMLKADICIMTTPSLEVLQIKRSRFVKHYCHITHSLLPMTYRAFALDYFDSVLVANEIQKDFVREVERAHNVKVKYIAVVGSTYLDELANLRESIKEKAHKKDKPTILVSPSWGKETLLSKYGMRLLEPLAKSPYHIIIRPHPQSLVGETESANIKHLQDALSNYSNVEWDIGTPNVIAFAKADLMISDFSSVIFDFVCLEGKPVITLDFTFDSAGYDLADIYDNIGEFWTFKALKQIGGKINENDFANIGKIIESALKSSTNIDSLNTIKSTLWQYPHNSGKKATLEILKIEKSLLESQLNKSILNHLDLTKNAIANLKSRESHGESHKDSHKSNSDSKPHSAPKKDS
ncbi:CDP-glycerol glycerophosphotransferase family protein [Helicobacter sp. 23-1048]